MSSGMKVRDKGHQILARTLYINVETAIRRSGWRLQPEHRPALKQAHNPEQCSEPMKASNTFIPRRPLGPGPSSSSAVLEGLVIFLTAAKPLTLCAGNSP